ncbi:MAG: hypothetical protein APF81_22820 [Desulfosporosinus sp. BRH_c37]|nr:MAG: hypothetical protein APF81_22820 [Desulfosporosinus sp. BRH_c37]
MPTETQELKQFKELLIKITDPNESEKEILKLYLEQYGITIFDHLDLVDLSVPILEKLDAIRILITASKEELQ